jgi:hypothetical protein
MPQPLRVGVIDHRRGLAAWRGYTRAATRFPAGTSRLPPSISGVTTNRTASVMLRFLAVEGQAPEVGAITQREDRCTGRGVERVFAPFPQRHGPGAAAAASGGSGSDHRLADSAAKTSACRRPGRRPLPSRCAGSTTWKLRSRRCAPRSRHSLPGIASRTLATLRTAYLRGLSEKSLPI